MGIKPTGATQSRPSFDSRIASWPRPTNQLAQSQHLLQRQTRTFLGTASLMPPQLPLVVDVKPHIFSTSTRKPCGFLGAPKAIFQNQLVVLTYIRLTTKILRAESSAIVRALPRIPILSPVINAFF